MRQLQYNLEVWWWVSHLYSQFIGWPVNQYTVQVQTWGLGLGLGLRVGFSFCYFERWTDITENVWCRYDNNWWLESHQCASNLTVSDEKWVALPRLFSDIVESIKILLDIMSRSDFRNANQIRPPSCSLGQVTEANGSCQFSQGNTEAIASVVRLYHSSYIIRAGLLQSTLFFVRLSSRICHQKIIVKRIEA